MEPFNYHHLHQFWTVVREGGVTRASEKLNVSQPTVSTQIRDLETALGEKLLTRSGRTVVLSEIGRRVYRYADEIFGLGNELVESVRGRPTARLEAFGQAGVGLFVMPSALEMELRRQYRVRLAGRLDGVRERYYAITLERKLKHPAAVAIAERARQMFE